MPAEFKETNCKSALDSVGIIGTRLWTRHCFDPYINCQFNCVYCNMGTWRHQNNKSSVPVCVKINAPRVLARELDRLKMKGVVSLGVATDVYQPAEEKYRLTRKLLEVLKEHNCPFAIGTKSDLVLRDLDIISEASKKLWCNVSFSITTLNEKIARTLEPNAPSPKRRMEAMRRVADEGIMTGIWLSPVLPYITDSDENIATVIKTAVENGAKFVLGGGLDMREAAGFKKFLEKNYTELVPEYQKLYTERDGTRLHYPNEYYLYPLYRKFIVTCNKYGVKSILPHFHTRRQAWLFYLRNFAQFRGTPFFEVTQMLNYLSPSKELLQNVRIRCGNGGFTNGFLKVLRYFPH